MRLYLAAAVVVAASGAAIRDHLKKPEVPVAPAVVRSAPAPSRLVEVARPAELPDAMSLGRVMASGEERPASGGGWVLPDPSLKPASVARHRPPARKGPQVVAATSNRGGPRTRSAIGVVGRIKDSLRVAMDKQSWRRSVAQNPFRDDARYAHRYSRRSR